MNINYFKTPNNLAKALLTTHPVNKAQTLLSYNMIFCHDIEDYLDN